jgi:hypothetical protein
MSLFNKRPPVNSFVTSNNSNKGRVIRRKMDRINGVMSLLKKWYNRKQRQLNKKEEEE